MRRIFQGAAGVSADTPVVPRELQLHREDELFRGDGDIREREAHRPEDQRGQGESGALAALRHGGQEGGGRMNPVCTYAGSLLTSCFHVLIMHKFMKAFFSRPSKNPLRFAAWTAYYILQTVPVLGISIPPPAMLSLNMELIITISSISYDAGMKRRCIFSALVCAAWMLMEITTDILLRLIGMDGWELQAAGTVISLMLMFLLAIVAGHYAKRMDRRDIPFRYAVAVLAVPAGSIYLMHNIFLITARHGEYAPFAIAAGLLLLLLIYMIFEIYDRMVDDAEAREKNLLYEQELELLNRHAKEREAYDAEMRRLRHDMKNHMAGLLGMLQGDDTKQAEEYVRGMLREPRSAGRMTFPGPATPSWTAS